MANTRIFQMTFSSIYPMYMQKVERKGQPKENVDTVICWLTGYDKAGLDRQITEETTLTEFFEQAPQMNPNVSLITGAICGVRVENIDDPLMQKIRYMDKLVDEVAKGKAMEKILRK
ncbi:DUF2200 domain-containing protein [Companilactobacillus nantensis]|uniref:DUF2200 domain-containing protein n=1 Tax=Companilactobacillus nantensis DSM 16982 TaxID=1423774 RepID=A0A0R1WHK3_9LACO|nr:DUF2200 domain-containing protein [Companilactobacillus nantensis]KRM17390.1 hypothetical protein FD31_GL000279 [Companilactobacillus nantensis DSM 16982]GEO65455.1 hypothetical protein LNA01_26380 [Companilactobacillus nantensis]